MIGFAFTIGAIRDVCERCPDNDIERVRELFDDNQNMVSMIDNMVWFITVLNKWYVYKETGSFDGAVKESELLGMEMSEIRDMFDSAMLAMKQDKEPDTEIEPAKKDMAAPSSKN